MFKTLQEMRIAMALNLPPYFGISMLDFIRLPMIEHTLPIGAPRTVVKFIKVLVGISFYVTSEIIDKTSSQALKALSLPNANLDIQATIGVPSDIKLEDVLTDMQQ